MEEYYTFNEAVSDAFAEPSEETRRFIGSFPKDFASSQIEALIAALGGDFAKLEAIRNARRTLPLNSPKVYISELNIEADSRPLRIRIYTPPGSINSKRNILVYYHGGGWTINCIESCERFCRDFCADSDSIVVVPDYRLAPENRYPAANIDCFETFKWVVKNAVIIGGSRDKIYLAGDSAGGHLAVSTAIAARDDRTVISKPAGISMFYPALDLADTARLSYHRYADGYCLNAKLMRLFINAYTGDGSNALKASPFYSNLEGLSRVLLISSQFDILHDESSEFAKKLSSAEVPVRYIAFNGASHLFITQKGMDGAYSRALKELIDFTKQNRHV